MTKLSQRGVAAKLAGLAIGVFTIFVICTLGLWLLAFAVNDVFCIVGPGRC